jgi:hypothetical protein
MKFKRTIVSKGINHYEADPSFNLSHRPQSGDLAVFEVVELGRHKSVQADDKRSVLIFPGDTILAAFADRYATSQFEGYVPDQPLELYDILGAGGAIGVVRTKNDDLKEVEPTKVKLVGYCTDKTGKIINTRFYGKNKKPFTGKTPNNAQVILSIGSTMDSGKTTTAAFVARGLKHTQSKVAYIKLTGTCFTKDRDFVFDCGADVTTDFAEMGYPSTYMASKEELLVLYQSLLDSLTTDRPDYIVMEIADGLFQRETSFLLRDKEFMSTISKVVFSCGDSLSAIYGVQLLREMGIETTLISGRFTMSPLLIKEVQDQSGLPVAHIDQLAMGEFNHLLA